MYSGNYRAPFLDYRHPGIFLITIVKTDKAPIFSFVKASPDSDTTNVRTIYTDVGQSIWKALKDFQNLYPFLQIIQYSIMPDHLHIVLNIRHRLDEHLGKYIARLKYLISQYANPFLPHPQDNETRLFLAGYNDQYLKRGRSLNDIIRYVKDNPYRLWVRRQNKHFFIYREDISLCGEKCRIYGNTFLLSNPFKEAVVVHSNSSATDIESIFSACMYKINNGGILAGAFISTTEKTIFNKALENEGKIILIRHFPASERWKPSGNLFRHCETGRLLIICPKDLDNFGPCDTISRAKCKFMNAFAEKIAAGNGTGIID